VNALHTAGFDQNGTAGVNFFGALGASSGAAAAMTMNAAIVADPKLVAAAGVAVAGDNQSARAISDLRDSRVLDSGTTTFNDAWSQLVYRVGRDAQSASDDQVNRAAIVQQIDALRDEVSGVSLDEEAMHLLKFQRAYEANARYFRVIDDSIQTLLNELGRT